MHVAMVAVFPCDLDYPRTAVEVATGPLVKAFLAKGVEVTVVDWRSKENEPSVHPQLGCPVIPLPVHSPPLVMNWLRSSREVRAIVERLRPDVVHVQGDPELGVALDAPVVFTMRGIAPKDEWILGGPRRYFTAPIKAFTFWRSRKRYKDVILISPYSRDIGGFRRDARLHDIFNPVDDRFFDVRRCEFTPTVLTIGNLSPLKNTLAVVQAAARLKDRIPGVRFRLAGRWGRTKAAYRQRIETVCRHAGLEETVEFIGFKNRDEIKEELARAACLFHPSFQENAPLVITEALTVGVPVVASRICGIPWMVQEGQTGFLFDPLRIDEMVDGLERILTDPERCERMGQAARRFAEENFRAEKVAARTIDVYRKAIADHQKEPQG